MKVCIVGTGNQGTGMAGLLAQESDCKELILVDILLEKAQKAEALVRSMGERCKCRNICVYQGDCSGARSLANRARSVSNITPA